MKMKMTKEEERFFIAAEAIAEVLDKLFKALPDFDQYNLGARIYVYDDKPVVTIGTDESRHITMIKRKGGWEML